VLGVPGNVQRSPPPSLPTEPIERISSGHPSERLAGASGSIRWDGQPLPAEGEAFLQTLWPENMTGTRTHGRGHALRIGEGGGGGFLGGARTEQFTFSTYPNHAASRANSTAVWTIRRALTPPSSTFRHVPTRGRPKPAWSLRRADYVPSQHNDRFTDGAMAEGVGVRDWAMVKKDLA